MSRKILCEKCGVLKPMHPEDVMNGWKRRQVPLLKARKLSNRGVTINGEFFSMRSLACDQCGKPIADGSPAIAETMWRGDIEPYDWEKDYQQK